MYNDLQMLWDTGDQNAPVKPGDTTTLDG